jgi:hypothetical protein
MLLLAGAAFVSAQELRSSDGTSVDITVGGVSAWQRAEEAMRRLLNEAYYRFVSGDRAGAQGLVEKAYAECYEGDFRRSVVELISGARAENIDEWFAYVKDALGTAKTQKEIQPDVNKARLAADAPRMKRIGITEQFDE